jgi:hypothetical protein
MVTNSRRSRKNKRYTDQPPSFKATITTISCPLPRVTEYAVVKGTQQSTITASATIDQKPTYYFSLYNAAVGAGFFDQYRYKAVRVSIRPQQNAVGLTTNSTTTVVPLYCVIDYDDDAALGSIGAAEAYSNCVVLEPGQSLSRTFKPRIAMAAYSGAFTSYANMEPQWIDAASNGVRHYGIKIYVPAATAGQTTLQSWDIVIESFIEMRQAI